MTIESEEKENRYKGKFKWLQKLFKCITLEQTKCDFCNNCKLSIYINSNSYDDK